MQCRMSETRRRSSVAPQPNPTHGIRCHLCDAGPLFHSSKPETWPEETWRWVKDICESPIPPGAVVCRACEKFIKRYTEESGVTPRWCTLVPLMQ